MSQKTVYLDNVPVGDEHPTVFMAEIGTFFNKDIDLAEDFLKHAVESGADVFKTEILHNPDVCLEEAGLIHRYNHAGGVEKENYRKLIERKIVPLDDYERLFNLCKKNSIPFVASVYDIEGVDFLKNQGAAAIKIPRNSANNVALLRYSAETRLPVIIDNGNLYLSEMVECIRLIKEFNDSPVIINHHPGCNPAPPESHNMKIVKTLKDALDIPVGLACHYRGDELLYLAVGAGVNIIEKGVVDNPDKKEQDVISALKLSDMEEVIKKVKNCWMALGADKPVIKLPRDKSTWKCFYAKKDLKKGDSINLEGFSFAWPMDQGISVEYWDVVKEKKLKYDLPKGKPLKWNFVDFDK